MAPPYSPDSWALYELSQTVFGDFFRFSHHRNYDDMSPYSSALPPLFPTLIAIVDGVFGTGARTGLYLAFIAYVVFAGLSERLALRLTGCPWVGLSAALFLLLGPQMLVSELTAGRTMPLQLCLYALVLLGLSHEGGSVSALRAFLIGLVSGLAVLNRFDAAILPLLAVVAVAVLTRSRLRSWQALAGVAAGLFPWVAYSLTAFGTVFATDNSRVAASLDQRAFVTDWWPNPQPSLVDAPWAYASKISGNAGELAGAFRAIVSGPLGEGLLVVLVLGAIVVFVNRRRRTTGSTLSTPDLRLVLGTVGGFVALLIPQLATGYAEHRYFSGLCWGLGLLVVGGVVSRGVTEVERRVLGAFVLNLAIVLLAPGMLERLSRPDLERWSDFERPGAVLALADCLRGDPDVRILVIGDDLFAAQAGALGGLAAMMTPRNIADGRVPAEGIRAFVEAWSVELVLVRASDTDSPSTSALSLRRVPDCDVELFSVES
ncbi:MAG: hypothetical protein AAGG08_07620 [Actinomycetota bacterium]